MENVQIAIYKISINNQCYIGSTINYKRRITQHLSNLKRCRHDNIILQNYWNKYNEWNVSILESFNSISDKDLRIKESEWIEKLKPKINIQNAVTKFNVKSVNKFDLDGTFIKKYQSVTLAAKENNCSESIIYHCCQNNEKFTKSAKGFLWSYSDTCIEYVNERFVKIYIYDISGKYIREYNSLQKMCQEMFPEKKRLENLVYRICNNKSASYNGYRFSYKKQDQLDNSLLLNIGKGYPVVQTSVDGKSVKIWNTIKHASEELNINRMSITTAIISGGSLFGYHWKRLGI